MTQESTAKPFPALAGMNRSSAISIGVSGPVPRARGDEPTLALLMAAFADRSPRSRG